MVILPATLLPVRDWHPLQGHDTETSPSARLTPYLKDWAHGISMHSELSGALNSVCHSWASLSWLPSLLLPKGQRPDHIVWILGQETDLPLTVEGVALSVLGLELILGAPCLQGWSGEVLPALGVVWVLLWESYPYSRYWMPSKFQTPASSFLYLRAFLSLKVYLPAIAAGGQKCQRINIPPNAPEKPYLLTNRTGYINALAPCPQVEEL